MSRWTEPEPCDGCKWYYEWFGVCCNGASEWRGGTSRRCELYDELPPEEPGPKRVPPTTRDGRCQ